RFERLDDVRVGELRADPRLVEEHLPAGGVVHEVWFQLLDDDDLAETRRSARERKMDDTHAPTVQLRKNMVLSKLRGRVVHRAHSVAQCTARCSPMRHACAPGSALAFARVCYTREGAVRLSWLLLLVAACKAERPTELVVGASTQMRVPHEIATMRVVVRGDASG